MCRRNTWGTLLQCIGNVGRVRVPIICLVLAHFLCFVFYIYIGEIYNRAYAHKIPCHK